jgi:hypothetical protein
MKNYKLLITAIVLFVVHSSYAQKLPNIQPGSLRAPTNIKVDGKPAEWGEHRQAYNHAVDVSYAIANDDFNLYLIIQSVDPGIIHKINSGSITLTINASGKKTNDHAIIISYPVAEKGLKAGLMLKDKPEIISGNAASIKKADSFANANNKRMSARNKMIKVIGVAGLDTLISVYNDDGIKTAASFNNKMTYTFECSVSLKLLGLPANDGRKLAYNIMVNPVSMDDLPGVEITRSSNGEITAINVHKDQALPGSTNMTNATDFWGEYALAKKP